ncbi:MAG TPA: histidine kinase [Saprospiraceae bacterium]|nr:histidine kinase [Saprospiraceae bacterium]
MHLILYGGRFWRELDIWLCSVPLMSVFCTTSWYQHMLHDHRAETRYPSLNDTRRRIMYKILPVVSVMPVSILAILWTYDHFHILGFQWKIHHTIEALTVGLSVNLVFITLFEIDYILNKYRDSKLERQVVAQHSIAQELDTLKNQINPHFLFNCFNTLSSLITVDKERANLFLSELSKVYRYLLRNNTEGVSTLKSELQFIESYFKLLHTRHGDAVRFHIKVHKEYENYLLPSLSLQLLVENAVKHNMVSKSKPLVIDIFTTAGSKLVVNNNLQRRVVKALSNRVGLNNIRHKYELLQQKGFHILEDEKNYTVVLPLIWQQN